MTVYLNGEYVPADEARISVFDGGYLYGDGIYTTLRLYHGLPLDLAAHHARLTKHLASMSIACPFDGEELRHVIGELVRRNDLAETDGRLRITISRSGDIERPLPLTNYEQMPATSVITLVPVSPELAIWQQQGIPVICLDASYARGNFPELKTLNGLATLSALRRAAAAGCPEALLTGLEDRLLEGAVSNIFLVVDGCLLTPASAGEFLAGRTRERILRIAAREEIPAKEAVIYRDRLAAASEVFVVSSVREVLPVTSIDRRPVGRGQPGPLTRLMQARYRDLIKRDLARQ